MADDTREEFLEKVPKWSEMITAIMQDRDITQLRLSDISGGNLKTINWMVNGKMTGKGIDTYLRVRKILKIPTDVFVAALEKEFLPEKKTKSRSRPRPKPRRRRPVRHQKKEEDVPKKKKRKRSSRY